MNLLSGLGNEVASEPINDFNGPVALGLRSADTGLRDSYTNNYFSDRSFTNLDKYEVVDSLSTVDAAKLGKKFKVEALSKNTSNHEIFAFFCLFEFFY